MKRAVDPPNEPRTRLRGVALGAALAVACSTLSCRPEVVVRLMTRIFPDGGVHRRLEVVGREADGSAPKGESWLGETAHLDLASRASWGRVEEGPGHLYAEGFFQTSRDLPSTLAHTTDAGIVADRVKVTVESSDLVVARLWVYHEEYGDPHGGESAANALDRLVDLACRALREELRLKFGGAVDPSPAEALFRGEGRAMISEIVAARAKQPGSAHRSERNRLWSEILVRHGVAVAPFPEEHFWAPQADALYAWSRFKVAGALSTPDRPVRPEDLDFWPTSDTEDARSKSIAQDVWGSEDEMVRLAEPLIEAMTGYYGGGSGPRFRFEERLALPGRILRTNGVLEDDGVFWLFRDEDLSAEPRVLDAEAVTLDDDKLRALGARRDLDVARLARLVDLLSLRDRTNALKELLEKAAVRGRLSVLRDDNVTTEEIQPLARELADLLDPAIR